MVCEASGVNVPFSMIPVVYTVFCAGRNIQFSRQYMETYFPASARPDQLLSVCFDRWLV